MRALQFKLDEHFPRAACELLRMHGHDAVSVLDQGLGGHPDAEIARVCRDEGRILVTLDVGFADIRMYPPKLHAGIIVLRLADQTKANVVSKLASIVPVFEAQDPNAALWVVDSKQIRVRR